jgi:pimeloyl-ACP methyl ester carboxylesterase
LTRFRAGGGASLLLVHGIGSSWRDWRPILDRLATAFDVAAVTLPGHLGGPELPAGERATLGALGDALEAEIDRLGFGVPHLVGNSLGGWLALELARRGRARSVVALAPAGFAEPWERDRLRRRLLRNQRLARVITPALGIIGRSAIASRLLLAGSVQDPRAIDPEEAIHKMRAFAGCRVFRDLASDLCAQPEPDLTPLRVPVALVWGDRDRIVPPACAKRLLAALPRAEYTELRGVGHLPMWDAPLRVAELIIDFTAREARQVAS